MMEQGHAEHGRAGGDTRAGLDERAAQRRGRHGQPAQWDPWG